MAGKHIKALSPGHNLKKSPVAIAEFNICDFKTLIDLGIPVEPEEFTTTKDLLSIQSKMKAPI